VWRDQMRSAELEIGLVRLALRNLLRNAFSHGGPEVSVLICIEEQPNPPALVISVLDDGVGPPPELLQPPTATPGTALAPPQTLAQRGLGLYIVRQVMARHGGTLELSANLPQGLVARLVFPQGVVDATDRPPPAA
jgi:signal transduction histidine kinase